MDFISFLNQRKTLSDAGDVNALTALEKEASDFVKQFLNGKYAAETETSPLFYSFFKTFAQTDNATLKENCERAIEIIQPLLDAFDEEHHLTHLDDLTENVIEHNLNQLAVFERLNPFEKKADDQLKFPVFSDLLRLTDQIEIKGTAENAHDLFVDTLIKASKLQVFMALSLSNEKIDQNLYLSTLRSSMENNLVLMFAADNIDAGMPPDDKKIARLQAEYQKLLKVIEG